jgi:hypothetical protein
VKGGAGAPPTQILCGPLERRSDPNVCNVRLRLGSTARGADEKRSHHLGWNVASNTTSLKISR